MIDLHEPQMERRMMATEKMQDQPQMERQMMATEKNAKLATDEHGWTQINSGEDFMKKRPKVRIELTLLRFAALDKEPRRKHDTRPFLSYPCSSAFICG